MTPTYTPRIFATSQYTVRKMTILWSLLLSLSWMRTACAEPVLFQGADVALGEQLIAQNNCVACHTQRVGGDGSSIYKPEGRIHTAGFLRGMVEQCNTELNLGFFPEEVTAVAAVLNRDYYKFKK